MSLPRRSPRWGWIAPIIFIPTAAAAQSDPGPICADRPGKATGTCTVAPGRVQLEVGLVDWSLHRNSGVRETSLTVGETVMKFGVSDRSNLAVSLNPYERSTVKAVSSKTSVPGIGGMAVSYKHRITSDGAPFEIAILPTVKIPTAKRSIGNGKLESSLLLPVSYAVPGSTISLGATPEVDWLADADGHGHHVAMAQVLTVGWEAKPRLTLSAEVWGQWEWDPTGTVKQASVDGSIAYLIRKNVQIDAGANLGLNRATPDVELYAGFATRF